MNNFNIKFSTNNSRNIVRTPQYVAQYGEVHRLNQKYVIELFVMTGSDRKFVVFEDIAIKDITNYNKAVITTQYGEVRLDTKDLKGLFRFFQTLSRGSASRNATITSGTMEVSGGSKINYRSNIEMFGNEKRANSQLKSIHIHEG